MNFFWSKLILPLLEAVQPNTIVEIGCAQGLNTMQLLSYAQPRDGKVIVIDPSPQFDLALTRAVFPTAFELKQGFSLHELPTITEADVVFIDGDHNWFTVYHELKILEQLERFPVVFLHDLEWPYGRRDMYYFPDSIPAEYRQPSAMKGILPGVRELVEDGHNSSVHNALLEHGPRNGVLTAIEDFLKETEHSLSLYRVHSQFGLGIIIPNHSTMLNEEIVQKAIAQSGH